MFRKEVNAGKLTSGQLVVYNIFTKTKGHPAHLSVTDSHLPSMSKCSKERTEKKLPYLKLLNI